MGVGNYFSGTGINYQSAAPVTPQGTASGGSSPVGMAWKNSTQGQQVNSPAGQDFAAQIQAILGQGNAQYNSDYGYQQQQGYNQALQYQMQMDALKKQMANAGGQAGLQQADNSIQQGALARQGPLLDQLLGLDKNANGRSLEDLIFGLNQGRAAFGDQGAALDQRGEQLDYSKMRGIQEANTSAGNQEFGLRSDSTARGAIGSQGMQRSYGNIQDQLSRSLGDIDKTYGWGKSDLDRSRNQLGRDKASLEEKSKLGYGQIMDQNTRLDLNDTEKRAQLDDEKKRLDNASKSIGMSSADTASRINSQLSQLGLSQVMNHNDVLKGLEDLRNNRLTNVSQAIQALQQQYGIDFNQLAGSQ